MIRGIPIIVVSPDVALFCSSFAGINPMELAKRNAPGMIVAVVVSMLLLVYK
jgi:DcuC family C4-dicarboxylate transporter